MFLPLPVVMVLIAIFLVFIPIIGEPVDAAIAVGLILPAIPVYFIFVYKYKHRPKIFTRINGMYNICICNALGVCDNAQNHISILTTKLS